MTKRTSTSDYKHIESSNDMEKVIRDKRKGKRASKQKAKRRNRHYEKLLLKEIKDNISDFQ